MIRSPSYACSTAPVAVKGLTDAVAVTAGDKHACALLADGGIECWGEGAYGQLGDGRMLDAALPVETRIP